MNEVFTRMFGAGISQGYPADKFDKQAGIVVNFFTKMPFMYGIKDCEEFLK